MNDDSADACDNVIDNDDNSYDCYTKFVTFQ